MTTWLNKARAAGAAADPQTRVIAAAATGPVLDVRKLRGPARKAVIAATGKAGEQ